MATRSRRVVNSAFARQLGYLGRQLDLQLISKEYAESQARAILAQRAPLAKGTKLRLADLIPAATWKFEEVPEIVKFAQKETQRQEAYAEYLKEQNQAAAHVARFASDDAEEIAACRQKSDESEEQKRAFMVEQKARQEEMEKENERQTSPCNYCAANEDAANYDAEDDEDDDEFETEPEGDSEKDAEDDDDEFENEPEGDSEENEDGARPSIDDAEDEAAGKSDETWLTLPDANVLVMPIRGEDPWDLDGDLPDEWYQRRDNIMHNRPAEIMQAPEHAHDIGEAEYADALYDTLQLVLIKRPQWRHHAKELLCSIYSRLSRENKWYEVLNMGRDEVTMYFIDHANHIIKHFDGNDELR